jgi:hypothetical protein
MYGTAYRDALNRTLALEDEFLYGNEAVAPVATTKRESAKASKGSPAPKDRTIAE